MLRMSVGWFDDGGLLPHGTCFLLRPDLIWLHVASDLVIALAYFMIPLTLLYFVRSKRVTLSFNWAIVLFAAFILLCGTGHAFDIATIWLPIYYLEGTVKALTAAVSILTAFAIIPLVPRLARMRTPEELEQANARLREEVAARERAEAELRRSLGELNRAVQDLEQFAYITSHDLQSPLRSICGFSQLLQQRYAPALDADGREFLGYIEDSSRHMRALILDLLALSRVGRTADLRFVTRPLGETLEKVVRIMREDIVRSGACIRWSGLPEITAEHGLLAQLLQNLIGNAIKFHKPDVAPLIEIRASAEGERWHLVVADNGIGIPAEQLDAIFAVFRRLHAPEVYEGTGVGLAICRKIAAYHSGEIHATSDGDGAQFHVYLPRHPQPPAARPAPRAAPALAAARG